MRTDRLKSNEEWEQTNKKLDRQTKNGTQDKENHKKYQTQTNQSMSMECSSMVSVANFNQGFPGSNPGWLTVSNPNKKLSVMKNKSNLYSSKYCKPVMGGILVVIKKLTLKL